MDLYSEYNRIRKNLLQQGRYYGIELSIPTAKQLNKPITKSEISKLQKIKISSDIKLKELPDASVKRFKSTRNLKSAPTPAPKKRTRVASIDEPLVPKRSKRETAPNTRQSSPLSDYEPVEVQRLTAEQIYEKYGSKFLSFQDGEWFDLITGKALDVNGAFTTKEMLGEEIRRLHPDFNDIMLKQDLIDAETDLADDLEYFKEYIEARLREAVTNRKEESDEGIEKVQRLIDKLTLEDVKNARERFEYLQDEIKNYLDVAIYYADEMTHDRALDTIDYLFDFTQDLNEVRLRIADTWEDIE